jgi:hypothetical protein
VRIGTAAAAPASCTASRYEVQPASSTASSQSPPKVRQRHQQHAPTTGQTVMLLSSGTAAHDEEPGEDPARPLLLPSSLRSSLRGLHVAGGSHEDPAAGSGGGESPARGKPQKVLFAASSSTTAATSKKGFPKAGSDGNRKAPSLLSAVLPSFRKQGYEADSIPGHRRLGGGGGSRRRRRRGAGRDSDGDGHGYGDGEDEYDDPVMALFQARASHRVTFCLEQQQQQQQNQQQQNQQQQSAASNSRQQQHDGLHREVKAKESGSRGKAKRGRTRRSKDDEEEDAAALGTSTADEQQLPRRSSSLKRFVQAALFSAKPGPPTSMADIEAEVAQIQSGENPSPSPSPRRREGESSEVDSDDDDDDMAPNPALPQDLGGVPDDASSLLPSASSTTAGGGGDASTVSSGHTSAAVPTAGSPSPPRDRNRAARHMYGGLGMGGTVDRTDGSEPPPIPLQQQQQRPLLIQHPPTVSPTAESPAASPSAANNNTPKRRSIRWGHSPNHHTTSNDKDKSPTPSTPSPSSSRKSHKAFSPKDGAAAAAVVGHPRSGIVPKSPPSNKSALMAAWAQQQPPPSQFVEQKQVRSQVNVLLNKASRAHHVHHRYEYAIKCCMKGTSTTKIEIESFR